MNRGQISLEYLIITGTILFLLVVPAAIFLSSFTRTSMHGTVRDEKVREIGDAFVDGAKQAYYMGLYAKKQVTVTIPESTVRFYVLDITTGGKTYHYLVLVTDDGKQQQEYLFHADVPIAAAPGPYVQSPPYPADIDVAECATASCTLTEFTAPVRRPGKRLFELETVGSPGGVRVQFTPVIP